MAKTSAAGEGMVPLLVGVWAVWTTGETTLPSRQDFSSAACQEADSVGVSYLHRCLTFLPVHMSLQAWKSQVIQWENQLGQPGLESQLFVPSRPIGYLTEPSLAEMGGMRAPCTSGSG